MSSLVFRKEQMAEIRIFCVPTPGEELGRILTYTPPFSPTFSLAAHYTLRKMVLALDFKSWIKKSPNQPT
jgi:hypothetical protein